MATVDKLRAVQQQLLDFHDFADGARLAARATDPNKVTVEDFVRLQEVTIKGMTFLMSATTQLRLVVEEVIELHGL